MDEKEHNEEREHLVVKNEPKLTCVDKIDTFFDRNKNFCFGITFFGRLVMTYYSFHGLFFIYNIIIEYLLLIPGYLFQIDSTSGKVFFGIVYFFFSISCSNLLIIPTYEFLTLPYLRYKNPLSHLLSFIYIFKEKEFNFDNIVKDYPKITLLLNLFFIIIEILYGVGSLLGLLTQIMLIKDITKLIILIYIYIYYLTLCFCYYLLSIYLILVIIKVIILKSLVVCCLGTLCCLFCFLLKFDDKDQQEEIKEEEKEGQAKKEEKEENPLNTFKGVIGDSFNLMYISTINEIFGKRPKLPDINLLSYIIEPFLLKNYEDENKKELKELTKTYSEDFFYNFKILFKVILSVIAFILCLKSKILDIDFWSFVFFLLLFLVISPITITFNFPTCFRNRKTFGACIDNPKIKLNENKYKPRHPNIIALVRIISVMILALLSIGLIIVFAFLHDDDNNDDFSDISLINNDNENDDLLLPNICYSSIYNLPIYLYMPFINDAYYYRSQLNETGYHYFSSLEKPNYTKLFFDDDYEISDIRNLINKTDSGTVRMIQYNVINKKKNIEITILSIKGTTFNKDIYLDAQLFFSSVLLNLLSTFSIITQKDSMSFKLIEYSLSIPYRIFFKFLIIDDYLQKLQKAYIDNEYTFYKNVVIVGHSLGGGLAKLFGRIVQKQAIALSGPGINAFHSLWKYKGKSENFEISAIDLVPDRDLVPRVEVSGGTIYRIICKFGALNCHSKANSLCEVLIMCNIPSYKEYCMKVAGLNNEQINMIIESIYLN